MGIVVPLEDGSMAQIEHLPLDAPTKMLGLMTCPTGSTQEVWRRWWRKQPDGRIRRARQRYISKQYGFCWRSSSGQR